MVDLPNAEDVIECHGGITYNDGISIGFDCAHSSDIPELGGYLKDVAFVEQELDRIIDQLEVLGCNPLQIELKS